MDFITKLHRADYSIFQLQAMKDALDEIGTIEDVTEIGGKILDQMGIQMLVEERQMAGPVLEKTYSAHARCNTCNYSLRSVSDYPCIECFYNSKWEEATNNA